MLARHGRLPDHGAGHPGGVRPGRRRARHRLPDRRARPRLAVPAGQQEHRAGRAVQPGRGAAGDHGRDRRGGAGRRTGCGRPRWPCRCCRRSCSRCAAGSPSSPSHFTERHGALVIIVLGESVVDIGIGAEGHRVTVSLALSAVLGLALTAALWWAYFGAEDDERAERAMVAARPGAPARRSRWPRTSTPTSPCCSGSSRWPPGSSRPSCDTGSTLPAGPCVAMGCGVALFLAGSAAFRHALRIGPGRYRLAAAAVALAASLGRGDAERGGRDGRC